VRPCQLDSRLQLRFIGVAVVVYPRADCNIEPVTFCKLGYVTQRAVDAVGADGVDPAGEEFEIGIDLAILGFFKYYDFFLSNVAAALAFTKKADAQFQLDFDDALH